MCSHRSVCTDEGQRLPDIPERELSLDVLTMDQLNHQRLESLSAMGGFNRQSLGSLGNLDSLGKLGGPLLQAPVILEGRSSIDACTSTRQQDDSREGQKSAAKCLLQVFTAVAL